MTETEIAKYCAHWNRLSALGSFYLIIATSSFNKPYLLNPRDITHSYSPKQSESIPCIKRRNCKTKYLYLFQPGYRLKAPVVESCSSKAFRPEEQHYFYSAEGLSRVVVQQLLVVMETHSQSFFCFYSIR